MTWQYPRAERYNTFAAFHAKDEVITADDLWFDPAIPETTESLAHRDPEAEKQRIIKA